MFWPISLALVGSSWKSHLHLTSHIMPLDLLKVALSFWNILTQHLLYNYGTSTHLSKLLPWNLSSPNLVNLPFVTLLPHSGFNHHNCDAWLCHFLKLKKKLMFNLSVDFKHFKRQIGFYKLYILQCLAHVLKYSLYPVTVQFCIWLFEY